MIRPVEEKDRSEYLSMAHRFYQSDAVLHAIPDSYLERTFDELISRSPFALGYVFEENETICGYALLARTWSQEAGGEVIWLEELYVKPEMRGNGYGNQFLDYMNAAFCGKAKRFRLEVEDENEGAVRLYRKKGFEFFPYQQMKKEV